MIQEPSKNGEKTGAGRDHRGRFRPGNRASPGRRQGSRNRASIMLDRIAETDAAAVLKVVLDAALNGDLQAAQLILGRVWPARKGRPVCADLPTLTRAQDAPAVMAAVLDALARGELTGDEGRAIADLVVAALKSFEAADFAQRLDALEARLTQGQSR